MNQHIELQKGSFRYCIECGSKMEISDFFIETFSPFTGRKVKMVQLNCPKGKWFRRHHSHFAIVVDTAKV